MAVVDRLFCQLRTRALVAVAVVERFKQEVMYGLSAGTKKSGRCREVAVVERLPLVEVRLYMTICREKRDQKLVAIECLIFSSMAKI